MVPALAAQSGTQLLSDSAKSVLGVIISRIGQEIQLAVGFKDDLRDLQRKLRSLDAIVSGAQPGFFKNNELLNDWLKQVREVGYQAEDVVEAYSYELLKRRIALKNRPQRFKTKIRFFFSVSSNPIVFRLRMAHKVKSVKESIDKIYYEAQQQGIRPVEVSAAANAPTRNYNYDNFRLDDRLRIQRERPDHKALVGRNSEKDHILELLRNASNSDQFLCVVGISGMAGLGKTTLCRNIFDLDETKRNFEKRIWICVSHDFNFIRILNSMVEFLVKRESNISEIATVETKLHDILQGKKYLLVLDDIWETFVPLWESMRSFLQAVGGVNGTTVLVTSRNEEVLSQLKTHSSNPKSTICVPCITYNPKTLGAKDSESLFKQFVGDDLSRPMKNLAEIMLVKCRGLPLAIKTLGGLLATQKEFKTWMAIGLNGIWNLEDPATASIKLSFDYLPSIQLKKCFAYCAIFEEDEYIEKDMLIQLWMAQGLLHDEAELHCDEELGEKYCHILLNNSLFQKEEFNYDHGSQIFIMHDVVHKLARDISRDCDIEGRHRLIQTEEDWPSGHGNNFRTFIASFDITRKEDFLTMTKGLRALSLAKADIEELPDSIGELKHLRYLDISRNEIKSLPVALANLYYLQTLRMQNVDIIPNEFMNLINLRHLWIGEWLRIPVGLGMLTSLQTLSEIDSSSIAGRGSELQTLNNLKGKLEIRNLKNAEIIEGLNEFELGKKENIDELVLWFYPYHDSIERFHDLDDEDVNHMLMLEALEPHPNLVALRINYYGFRKLPRWMMKMIGYGGSPLDNLISLEIHECWIEQLPSMNNLRALQTLQIRGCFEMNYVGDMSCLVYLRRLEIDDCIKLTCLPTGLSNLSNLKVLKIKTLNEKLSIFPFPSINKLSPLSASLEELSICGYSMWDCEEISDEMQHLYALKSLEIDDFSMKELPEWLGNLTSLQKLQISRLGQIETLPSLDALSQLTTLKIKSCSKLQDACFFGESELIKIQNIPHLHIEGYDLWKLGYLSPPI